MQFDIERNMNHQLTHDLQDRYKKLPWMRKKGIEHTNAKCQKLCIIGVPYSLEFQKYHKTMEL